MQETTKQLKELAEKVAHAAGIDLSEIRFPVVDTRRYPGATYTWRNWQYGKLTGSCGDPYAGNFKNPDVYWESVCIALSAILHKVGALGDGEPLSKILQSTETANRARTAVVKAAEKSAALSPDNTEKGGLRQRFER